METCGDDSSGYWAGLMSEQKLSGLTVPEFCRDRGVSFHRYRAWRTRLNKRPSRSGGWALMQPETVPVGPAAIALRIGSVGIDLFPGFDPQLLRDIVCALESR